jgi:hypothetical protein
VSALGVDAPAAIALVNALLRFFSRLRASFALAWAELASSAHSAKSW